MDDRDTDCLRRAVASGDFREALRLWEDYTSRIRGEIARGACTQAQLDETRGFLDWARRTVLCMRSQAQNQLNTIHAARRYETASPRLPSLVHTTL